MDLLNRLNSLTGKARARALFSWRKSVQREINAYVRKAIKNTKFRRLKPKGRVFGVSQVRGDGESLRIFGSKPNAGLLFGFNAPLNKRKKSAAIHVETKRGWRTFRKKQVFGSSLGNDIEAADVPYKGTSARPRGAFFGIKRKSKKLAFAYVGEDLALPVYSDDDVAQWLMETQRDKVDEIIQACGEKAIKKALGL